MIWILQDKGYGLGNFVNVTPVIAYFYKTTGKPVPVFFETPYIRELYEDHPWIEVLQLMPDSYPQKEPTASSSMVNRANDMPDYVWLFEKVTGKPYLNKYRPFTLPKFLVLVNGAGSERKEYVEGKDPGEAFYIKAAEIGKDLGFIVCFTGSCADLQRNGWVRSHVGEDQIITGDIRDAVSVLRMASAVITNDTGLAHVAGTMDAPLLVLWKYTPKLRCQNSGGDTSYIDAHSCTALLQMEDWLKEKANA